MSFGLLKHFKESKSENTHVLRSKHYPHVILGQDLGAVIKLVELLRTEAENSVRLITTRPINKQTLIENYDYGILQLRSAAAVECIYKKYFNAKILPQSKEATFYKDGKFHDFAGRAKSMDLKSGEEFFINKGYKIELKSLFTPQEWEDLDVILNNHSEIRILESIEKTVPEDLIDKKEWSFHFKDFSALTCENVYISMSPKKFLGFIHNKEKITSELIDFCSSAEIHAGISMTWKLDKEIYHEERTLFIPQSMTHEWGHFIVEFETFDHHKKEQICHILFLLHEEGPQSEEMASKIKLMKRVIDRVFPSIEKHIKKEYIRFDEEMFISGIKDSTIEQISFDYPTLRFSGQLSPMTSDMTQEKYLSRVLIN
jgi:hypothetical protein